jgi:tRNA (adenine22-N1)-methyltransferase
VAAAVPARAMSVADVGAGDGQLARHLAGRGLRVVATERSLGPFARLHAASPGVDCRLGEGLSVLSPGEVEGAVVAGMGGRSIVRLLSASPDVVGELSWLVAQPQQHSAELVEWLRGSGFRIEKEEVVVDRGRSYTVLLVTPPSHEHS